MDKDILLDKYLRGELSEVELIEFQRLKKEDPSFSNELRTREILVKGIKLNHLEEKMSMLKELEKTIAKPQNKGRVVTLFSPRVLSIAASVALLIGATLWLMPSTQSSDLYGEYYAFLPASEVVRGDDDPFQIALGKYNSKDFSGALQSLNEINIARALFYKGICQMELKNYEGAIISFENYIKSKGIESYLPAEYYMALCYLKIGNVEDAILALKSVPEAESYYFSKSHELLKKL